MKVTKSECLVCIAVLVAKPDKVEDLLHVFYKLIQNSTKEPGIVRYELHQDEENPRKFTFVDRFKNLEAFGFHCEQPYIKRAFDEGELEALCESMDITTHREIKLEIGRDQNFIGAMNEI